MIYKLNYQHKVQYEKSMVGFCQLTQNKPNKLFYFGVIHFVTANKRELITIMLFVSQLHLALRERNNQPKAKKFSFKLFSFASIYKPRLIS